MSNIKKQITLNVTGNQRTKKYNIQLTEIKDAYSNVINIGDKIVLSGRNGNIIYGFYLGLRKTQSVYLYFTSYGHVDISYSPYTPFKACWHSNVVPDVYSCLNDYTSQIQNNSINVSLKL